jgi:hypothetical protein
MTPRDKCVQDLTPLARSDVPNRVILMESAVNSFIKAAGPDTGRQIEALDALEHVVVRQQFEELILAYIERQAGDPMKKGPTNRSAGPQRRVPAVMGIVYQIRTNRRLPLSAEMR